MTILLVAVAHSVEEWGAGDVRYRSFREAIMGRISIGALQVLSAAGFLFVGTPILAQIPEGAGSACAPIEISPVEGEGPQLYIVCGKYAVTLGSVDSYEFTQVPALRSAVIVTTLEGSRRAFLVIEHGEEGVALEEITGAIARKAGRGARSDIDGIQLNLRSAPTGLMAAAVRSADANGADSVTIDLSALVERSRAVRGETQPKDHQ